MFQHILGQYCVIKAYSTPCQVWGSHLTQLMMQWIFGKDDSVG